MGPNFVTRPNPWIDPNHVHLWT